MSAAADEARLLALREEFPTLAHTLHFISHSLGAMPRGVEEALSTYAATWRTRSIRAWDESWFALPTEVADVLGGILNAAPGSIAMHANVTDAQAVALSALTFTKERPRVVCTEEDFPSVLYLYEGLARRGAELVRVRSRDGHAIDEADVLAAIDERTALVAISHVLFRTAQVLDLTPIVARAHACGALTMIDAYQSVGTVPVDVAALGCDLMTGGSVKWLCGGPGAGWLYVAPRVAQALEPAHTGWMAHERPFDFDSGPTRRHAGARRFWTGTPPVVAFAAARPGYTLVARAGVPAIRAKSLRQTARLIALADARGYRVVSPRDDAQRGGTVVLDVPHAEAVCHTLLARDVLLDFRPGVGLRLAPHYYTRDDELDAVVARIDEAVREHSGR